MRGWDITPQLTMGVFLDSGLDISAQVAGTRHAAYFQLLETAKLRQRQFRRRVN